MTNKSQDSGIREKLLLSELCFISGQLFNGTLKWPRTMQRIELQDKTCEVVKNFLKLQSGQKEMPLEF